MFIGDWLAVEITLPSKPETLRIAAATGRSPEEVAGICITLWAWFNLHTEDGLARHASVTLLRDICHKADETFAAAMRDVGWLDVSAEGVRVPRFERWNGDSAKKRLGAARRKRKERHSLPDDAPPVTPPSRDGVTPVTRRCDGESRSLRERKRSKNKPPSEVSPETPPASSGEPGEAAGESLLAFPCDGPRREWHLRQATVDRLHAAYPSLDILGEARKALAWVEANPGRRKTHDGMARFLTNWMSRAQNDGRGTGQGRAAAARPATPSFDDRLAQLDLPDRPATPPAPQEPRKEPRP
jgi:hypothetical protein